MEEIQLNSCVTDTSTGIRDAVLNVEPVKLKPQPPLVPPKPLKSRLGLVSTPELDQSFVTDDKSSGYNLNVRNSLLSSRSDSENQIQEQFPHEAGDCSQMLMLSTLEPITIPNLSKSEPEKASIALDPSVSGCPFHKLHHKTPCEFLSLPSLPQIADEDKTILLGIDDLSSDVEHKIKFIVGNLENCGGIWPLMFIEKLNRLIVSADLMAVKACFQDEELSLIDKLVDLYRNTKRCSVMFRYWCTFYNILARNLVPFPSLGSSGILELLKRDFILVAKGECKCKDDSKVNPTVCSGKLETDVEHSSISSNEQMQIISILLIPMFTAQADLKYLNSDTESEKQFMLTVLKVISDKPVLKLAALFSEKNSCVEKDQNHLKDILVHLLLAYNIQYSTKKLEINPLIGTILNDDGSAFKAKLIQIYAQEQDLLMKGCLDGIGSLVSQAPLGFQTGGVNGPLKLLINIFDCDKGNFFDVDDLRSMLTITSDVHKALSQDGFWDDKTEEIYNNCLVLQERLEFKFGYFLTEIDRMNPSKSQLNSSRSSHSSQENPTDQSGADATPTIGRGKCGLLRCNHKPKNDGLIKMKDTRFTMWPVEILMKCFGCSKRKATVAPATAEDLDYL